MATESAMVYKLRNEAIGNLLKLAPNSEVIHKIGQEFGLSTGMKPDGCIRCRLCIRACSDIIGANALAMVKRDNIQYVGPSETGTCIGCGTCASICPTGAIRCEDHESVRTIVIRDEVIGRNALERCDICGRYYATLPLSGVCKTARGRSSVREGTAPSLPYLCQGLCKTKCSDDYPAPRKDIPWHAGCIIRSGHDPCYSTYLIYTIRNHSPHPETSQGSKSCPKISAR